jgi:hypothetical protein
MTLDGDGLPPVAGERIGRSDAHRFGPSRTGAALALALVIGLSTAGCATHAALGQARVACGHVATALALFSRARAEGTSPQAATDTAASVAQLRAALPAASLAAGQSAQWQALMATLSESGRVPEAYLVQALGAQCASAAAGGS